MPDAPLPLWKKLAFASVPLLGFLVVVEGVARWLLPDRIEEIVVFPDNTMVETVVLGRRYLPPSQDSAHG